MRQRQSSSAERFRVVDELLGTGDAPLEPLDETEQENVIREFEALSAAQQRTWRIVIGVGLLAAGLFFTHAAWRQHVEPYGVRYTGELRLGVLGPPGAVTAALGLQAAALAAAAAALLCGLPPRAVRGSKDRQGRERGGCLPFGARQRAALWGGVAAAAVGAAFWGAGLLRTGSKYGTYHWELSWLPGGPLAGCLLAVYTAAMLEDTEREVRRLRSYRYRYKAA